ncbi:hypothetical protein K493DRAFT_302513 [Basidiobolus meristosporus CBS 931.73]|uniref:Peptidase C51 domain-containing protein n=1 Tax=Basidiobolus meristosporus CBS 931.73 TaxID=1314790 RepID=A0A1Y1Y6R2_9FUNG|nr:hypothetical protein K493DRAFT_302513 [Basidiobolus meristosporus CBS 931.73]|eukprot:ORX93710.1 hypothetical protein K493DRAFT_302513 [Basidiobolus meristosporus CBS 931.73]
MVRITALSFALLGAVSLIEFTALALPAPVANAPSNLSTQQNTTEVRSKLDSITNLASCSLDHRYNNGECTDWADARYYQLTCQHTTWMGDARTWPSSARSAGGWTVSSQPRVPSIIVIQPGYQGCGATGHVAVVERINSDGSVYTSNWNYEFNGKGGLYTTSYGNFNTGSGVSFIWK